MQILTFFFQILFEMLYCYNEEEKIKANNPMLNNYTKFEIDYSELEEFDILLDTPFTLCVNRDGVKYDFLMKIRETAENLLFMGSGAFNPEKFSPPVFQRFAWMDDFNDSLIYYNDPTLYLQKITLGWGNGTQKRHYLEELSEIAQILINKLNYQKEKVYFYGSSAGGYMSLMLAGFVEGTTAIVNNPQTLVMNYYPRPVKEMLQASYPGMEEKEILNQFTNRLNVVEFYKSINYVPKVHYLQNIVSIADIEKHLTPFISGLKSFSDNTFAKNIIITLYANSEQGHSPVSKEETLEFINKIINNKA